MDIILISADKLKVTLNRQDVSLLAIDLKNPDCSREDNRRLFLYLLEQGKADTGFSPSGAKVFIEVYPDGDGGCVVYFTAFDKAQYPKHPTQMARLKPVVFSFDDCDDLCDGAVSLYKKYSHRIFKSSLYYYSGEFRLVVYPLDYCDRLSVYLISEYASRIGDGEILAAFIEEHGKEIIRDTAIDTLHEYFG